MTVTIILFPQQFCEYEVKLFLRYIISVLLEDCSYLRCKKQSMKVVFNCNMFHLNPLASCS